MKKIYSSPDFYEIKLDDVIAASELKIENAGEGLSLDFSELL
jgi:hypothetical protein